MENFLKSTVKVPNRSGHYLGHHFLYTAGIGEMIPILCQPLCPGSKVSLKVLMESALAPLASSTYLHCSMRLEAFAVPLRFLYGGYELWASRDFLYPSSSATYSQRRGVLMPRLKLTGSQFKIYCKTGTLSDYLGVRVDTTDLSYIQDTDTIFLNIFPYLAYWYLWDTWYRRADLQTSFFRRPSRGQGIDTRHVRFLPYLAEDSLGPNAYGMFDISTTDILGTIQRNFPIDYFTSAMVSSQLGDEQTVSVVPDSSDGHISISAIRAANSLQVWRERQGLCGIRFADWLKSTYGTDLPDSNGRRPMYLGSGVLDFYSKGVDQSYNATSASVATNNPFTSVGARYGQPSSSGEINLIDDFECLEPCYLMVIATAVPKVMYSSGIERYMLHYTKDGCESDLANPILQNVGNQEIRMAEIAAPAVVEPVGGSSVPNINSIFGYQQRYVEYMMRNDRVSGLYRDGQSLQSFVAQRYVGTPSSGTPGQSGTTITDAFLRIPKNYLDQVSAVGSSVSTYGVMSDVFFDFGVSQPLYDSSVPSLVNPAEEHGRNVVVMRGGKRIV